MWSRARERFPATVALGYSALAPRIATALPDAAGEDSRAFSGFDVPQSGESIGKNDTTQL